MPLARLTPAPVTKSTSPRVAVRSVESSVSGSDMARVYAGTDTGSGA